MTNDSVRQEIAEWTNALRSRVFLQGKGELATVQEDGTVRYCCLGVKCFLDVQDGLLSSQILKDKDIYSDGSLGFYHKPGTRIMYDRETVVLPQEIALRLNIMPSGEFFIKPIIKYFTNSELSIMQSIARSTSNLTVLNDRGITFDRIADIIELIEKHDAWVPLNAVYVDA